MDEHTTTDTPVDFGSVLNDILDHVTRKRRLHWPFHLAAIDQQGQMMLQTLKAEGGVTVHYPEGPLGFHALFRLPIHLLLVDRDGKAVKATMLDTGQWLLG